MRIETTRSQISKLNKKWRLWVADRISRKHATYFGVSLWTGNKLRTTIFRWSRLSCIFFFQALKLYATCMPQYAAHRYVYATRESWNKMCTPPRIPAWIANPTLRRITAQKENNYKLNIPIINFAVNGVFMTNFLYRISLMCFIKTRF